MSGSTGADRVLRTDIPKILKKIKQILTDFSFEYKGNYITPFTGHTELSGSINSNLSKQDFGDVDLIATFDIPPNLTKNILAKELTQWLIENRKSELIPFKTEKHKGKLVNNSFGSIITIMIKVPDKDVLAQVDIILSLNIMETEFKKQFLDMPAEKQGLIIGLVKTVLLETDPRDIFKRINIPYRELPEDKEYDFTLSSSGLSIDIVNKFDPNKPKIKETKENITKLTNWNIIIELLKEYDISNKQFNDLIEILKNKDWKNQRSLKRVLGSFNAMVLTTSGEIGTEKGNRKEEARSKVKALLNESIFEFYLEKVRNVSK